MVRQGFVGVPHVALSAPSLVTRRVAEVAEATPHITIAALSAAMKIENNLNA
jgi:hypothetical protein